MGDSDGVVSEVQIKRADNGFLVRSYSKPNKELVAITLAEALELARKIME